MRPGYGAVGGLDKVAEKGAVLVDGESLVAEVLGIGAEVGGLSGGGADRPFVGGGSWLLGVGEDAGKEPNQDGERFVDGGRQGVSQCMTF